MTDNEASERNERTFTIEPFDPDRHDRSSFSCGVAQVDNYFRKTAGKLARADNVRMFVMVAPDGAVAGFYALNAHSVHYSELPKRYARTRPGHGTIPAGFISMIGRDERFRGSGYGSVLLADALKRIATAADSLGLAVVMLDVLDCGVVERTARRKALYDSYGFQALASNPMRMFLSIGTVRELVDLGGNQGSAK